VTGGRQLPFRTISRRSDRLPRRPRRGSANITPKLLDLLLHLLDRAGELVTKEQLLDALWPDANVDVPDIQDSHESQRGTRTGSVGHPLPGVAAMVVNQDTGEGPLFDREACCLSKARTRCWGISANLQANGILSSASINRVIELLQHMMNWAVGREYLERTPFRRGTETLIRKQHEDNQWRRRISEEEETIYWRPHRRSAVDDRRSENHRETEPN